MDRKDMDSQSKTKEKDPKRSRTEKVPEQSGDKPVKTAKPAANRRPKDVRVYQSWCKKCGICAAFCPTKALEIGPAGNPVWKHPDLCIGCRMCELRCPDFAIEVVKDATKEKVNAGK